MSTKKHISQTLNKNLIYLFFMQRFNIVNFIADLLFECKGAFSYT